MVRETLNCIFVVTTLDVKQLYPALSDSDVTNLIAGGVIPDSVFGIARLVLGIPGDRTIQKEVWNSFAPEMLPAVAATFPEGTSDPLDAIEAKGRTGAISHRFGGSTINYSLIHTDWDGFRKAQTNGFLTDATKVASSIKLLQPIRTGTWTVAP